MGNVTENFLRDQLLDRRQKLESILAGSQEHAQLTQLLNDVDSALQRMDDGSYGICETCHEPVEKDRLLADPLVRYCLDHLTEEGRRALEQDLELASQMQRALLPQQDWRLGGWEIRHHYAPLGPVSGDYCDVIVQENDSNNFFFVLGDAAGKGIAASMLMAHLHAIFRTLLAARLPLCELVRQAGRAFCESTVSPYFATLACGRAAPDGGIEIINAGHCRPLLIRGGQVTPLEASGLPLGMFCDGQYETQSARLESGDSLFLYTDGMTEAQSREGEEFGEQRLAEAAMRHHTLRPRQFMEEFLKAHADFRRGERAKDDLTLLLIRRTG
jgi:phosphoserine phosphatase RsbU/P